MGITVSAFRDAIAAEARRRYCDDLVDVGIYTDPDRVGFQGIPALNFFLWANDRYREFCNREPQPLEQPPFTGGQCEFCYRVTVTFTRSGTPGGQFDGQVTQTYDLWGPIGPVSWREIEGSNPRVATLLLRSHGFCNLPRSASQREDRGTPFSFPRPGQLSIDAVVVRPVSGGSDLCGNLPRDVPEPRRPDPQDAPDFTYIDNSNNSVNVPLSFNFGWAYFDNDLNLNVPIDVNVIAPINVETNISPTFRLNFNLSTGDTTILPPSPNPDRPAPDPRGPGNPPNFGPGDEPPSAPPGLPPATDPDPVEPGQDRVIRAALVTVTSVADPIPTTELLQGENPNLWVPDLGVISFLVRSGRSSGGWTEDIRIKNRRQFVPCPWEGGAIRVAGTPRLGVEWEITPVYGLVDL